MRNVVGWLGIAVCTLIAGFWGFWGSIEGFHEGWYHGSLASNLLHYVLYLLPGMVIAGLAVVAVHLPKLGAALLSLLGVLVFAWAVPFHNFRLEGSNWTILVVFTLFPVALGAVLLWCPPSPRRAAAWIAGGVPLIVMLVSGTCVAISVLQRVDDGNRGERMVCGNGVALVWAGAGPGWARSGSVSWYDARRRCAYLRADGKTLAETPQNVWRLPTVDELVRSMALHGKNSGGTWDSRTGSAHYRLRPDKESPLWDTSSPVTYYWTGTERDDTRAYWVVYHGGVFVKPKKSNPGNVGFRAVREAWPKGRNGNE